MAHLSFLQIAFTEFIKISESGTNPHLTTATFLDGVLKTKFSLLSLVWWVAIDTLPEVVMEMLCWTFLPLGWPDHFRIHRICWIQWKPCRENSVNSLNPSRFDETTDCVKNNNSHADWVCDGKTFLHLQPQLTDYLSTHQFLEWSVHMDPQLWPVGHSHFYFSFWNELEFV